MEKVRKILSQHLGLEPAREIPTETEDIERELAEAGHLKTTVHCRGFGCNPRGVDGGGRRVCEEDGCKSKEEGGEARRYVQCRKCSSNMTEREQAREREAIPRV
jgi:hypothetical protein